MNRVRVKCLTALAPWAALVCLACASKPETFSVAAADRAVSDRDHDRGTEATPVATPECHIDAEIAAAVRLRGLPVLAPIRCQILDHKAMVERAMATALRETPKEWIDGQVQWLILLGLAPDGFEMLPAVGSLLDEQLAGFYDPQEDVLFVTADTADRMTLVHEVVHALQDQHFDLGKRMHEAKTSDALSALQILAEGDATSAMLEIPRDHGQSSAAVADVLNNVGAFFAEATATEVPVPAILKRGLIAPYLDGFSLIEGLRAHGDWQAVNAVWAQSPQVSAQLLSEDPLHWGNTVQQSIQTLPAAPPWRPVVAALYDDVTGEQSLRVLFEEWLARSKAAEAARGWLADRVTVWIDQGTSAFFWRMRWASAQDTQQALRAFAKGYFPEQIETLTPSSRTTKTLTRGCEKNSAGHPLALATRGQEIVLVAQTRAAGSGREVCEHLAQWAKSAFP